MACPDFEELIQQGFSGHAAHCDDCRARLEALSHVDTVLDAAFTGIKAPPGFAASVRARITTATAISRPPVLPEVLDFIGWAAILGVAGFLLPRLFLHALVWLG